MVEEADAYKDKRKTKEEKKIIPSFLSLSLSPLLFPYPTLPIPLSLHPPPASYPHPRPSICQAAGVTAGDGVLPEAGPLHARTLEA